MVDATCKLEKLEKLGKRQNLAKRRTKIYLNFPPKNLQTEFQRDKRVNHVSDTF